MSSRFWVFTLFEEDKISDYKGWMERLYADGAQYITYICGQVERSPDTQRAHIQGYVVFNSRRRLHKAKQLLESDSIHIEPRRGSHNQAVEYCKKDDTKVEEFVEFGEYSRGNSANALLKVKEMIDDGASIQDVQDEHFGLWAKYRNSFREYYESRHENTEPRNFETEVRVYWGVSGSGKTHRAVEELGHGYFEKNSEKWWDKYDGFANILLDEYKGSWMPKFELLKLMGNKSCKLPRRGMHPVEAAPKLIIITAQDHPLDWYKDSSEEERFALFRRFHVVEEFTKRVDHVDDDSVFNMMKRSGRNTNYKNFEKENSQSNLSGWCENGV